MHKTFKIIFLVIWIINLSQVSGNTAVERNADTTVLLAVDTQIKHFVKIVQSKYSLPLTTYEINRNILTASLMFDALGAYGVKYSSSDLPPQIFSNLMGKDTLNLIPSLKIFNDGRGSEEALAVIYAAILEASGIQSAFVRDSVKTFVLLNTGVHKIYSGALSRNIRSYLVRNNYVWLAIDMTKLGKPFHTAWQSTFGKLFGKIYDVLPVEGFSRNNKIKRATIFSSSIKKKKIDKLFSRDQAQFENDQNMSKLEKVTAIMGANKIKSTNHFTSGWRYLNSGEYDEAIKEFTRAEKLGGNTGLALFLIAKAQREKKDYQGMKKTGIKLVQFNKRDPRGYRVLGFAYLYLKNSNVGDKFLEKAKFLENHSLMVNK